MFAVGLRLKFVGQIRAVVIIASVASYIPKRRIGSGQSSNLNPKILNEEAITNNACRLCSFLRVGSGAEVYSANTVGYTRVAVNSGLNLLGSQFVEVGTDAALDINEVVLPAAEVAGLNENYEFQTLLQTWDGTAYAIYGYCADGQGTELFGDPSWDGKWLSIAMDGVAVVDIPAGSGFWVQTSGNSSVTMMGQVASAETTKVNVISGLNLLSSAYPKAVNIQDVVPSAELPGLNEMYEFQTLLQTWDGTAYAIYGYCADGQGTELFGDPSWDGKWLSIAMDGVADVTLPAGSGFWVQTSGTGTVTFTK